MWLRLDSSQAQPQFKDSSAYRQLRPTVQGSNRSSGTRWHTHLWVCFTHPAASKSTAHEYLSFPLLLRRTLEVPLEGALGLLASSSIIRNWPCRPAGELVNKSS